MDLSVDHRRRPGLAERQRYECDMIDKNDTHFYVGNLHGHQDTWLIVGLFYPPKPIGDLFDIA